MKKTLTIMLAIFFLLTSCAPAVNTMPSALLSNVQWTASSQPAHSAGLHVEAQNLDTSADFSTMDYTLDDVQNLPLSPGLDYEFLPASHQWADLVATEKPATLHATYELADNVMIVTKDVTNRIASAGQLMSGSPEQTLLPNRIIAEGGYVPTDLLDAAAAGSGRTIESGTVVVDPSTGTAFKVVSPTVFTGVFDVDETLHKLVEPLKGTYAITTPALHEIIKDFELPEQTIHLTRGNISGFAPHIEKNMVAPTGFKQLAFGDSLKDFKYLSDDPMVKLQFPNEKLDAKLGGGSPISVTVSGGLGIEDIELTGKYSGSGGYKIAVTLKQESYLVVELDATVNDEIRIPIFGIDVPFGIGRITGGVFAIVGMDGTLKLEIDTREYTSTTLGVRGSTKFYIPTSVHPIFDQEFKSDGEVDLAGDIDGYLKFGPMLGIELFGLDLVGAGVLLGAGVHVQADGHYLDVELYGIFNVYIKFIGDTYNLANYRPTILHRKQANLAGYRINFLEAYVMPGRAGGTIQMEPPEPGAKNIPAANLPYRVLAVPAAVSFNPDLPGDVDKTEIRKYPAADWALTNDEGEFIQMDGAIVMDSSGQLIQTGDPSANSPDQFFLNKDDAVYLMFQANGKVYFSDPVSPTLPFERITVTGADYYNDFVTGQVQPIRVINWTAAKDAPPEEQYMWANYQNGLIYVNPFIWTNYNLHIPRGGQARTLTDEHGKFDTRNLLTIGGKTLANEYFDVYENIESHGAAGGFDLTLDHHDATISRRVQFHTTMTMAFSRVLDEVGGPYKRYSENGEIIDQMVYDEYIWIVNPNGTRTATDAEFRYLADKFSTQDFHIDDLYYTDREGYRKFEWQHGYLGENKLIPVLDESGHPTGTALFSQRVTVEWVWHAHPNPILITSPDHTETKANAESTFQVTANGFLPRFSLEGAPSRVWVDEKSGLLHITKTVEPGNYTFTIHAREGNAIVMKGDDDPKKGNDPSPPDKQTFKLTVVADPAEPDQPPVDEPFVPPSTSPQARTAPVIRTDEYNTNFTMDKSKDLTVPFSASGSPPIKWSVLAQSATGAPVPDITINGKTGVLTVKKGIAAGSYALTVKATNDVGADTQDCVLNVTQPRTPPIIGQAEHGYVFSKLVGGATLTVPVSASGSAPITWSLVQTSERYVIPQEVSIDPATGVLTIQDGMDKGEYFFTIKADNDMGSDTQDCTLNVLSMIILPKPPAGLGLTKPLGSLETVTLLAAASANRPNSLLISQTTPQSGQAPPNTLTIRYDDPRDVYTNDRYTVNGARFVHWQSCPGVELNSAGVGTMFLDESPRCDNYHWWANPIVISDSMQKKILQSFKEQLSKYQSEDIFLGERLTSQGLLEQFNNYSINQMEEGVTYLNYGSVLDTMNKQKGGSFQVELTDDTGSMVTGKYFAGLKNNKTAQLSFLQDGATITFAGQDVKTTSELDLFDFGYYAGAFSETELLAAAGSGGESFSFAFAHHGPLPGMATFAVTTDLAAGTQVNVYKFDAGTNRFTTVAQGLTVGNRGVVTYQNDTMSEYLVTTLNIPGAAVSNVVQQQGPIRENNWLFIGIGVVVLLSGAILSIVLSRRKRKSQPQQ